MTLSRTKLSISIATLAAAVLWPAGAGGPGGRALAQRKAQPACGIAAIPFVEGNEWVYKAVTLATEQAAQDQPNKPPTPKQPAEFRIKVVSVKTEGKTTSVTLQETAKDHFDVTAVVKCTRDQVVVPLESFFFMGEPGAATRLELTNLEQPGPSYGLRFGRLIRSDVRSEFIKADIVRTTAEGTGAKIPAAKLDLERKIEVAGIPSNIATEMGPFKALQVRTELRGSVVVEASDPGEQPNELLFPEGNISDLWFVDGVGMVQARNRYNHTYQLASAKLN